MSDQSNFRKDIDIVRRVFNIHIPFGEALQAMRLHDGDVVSAVMHIAHERCPPIPTQTAQSINGNWRKPRTPI